MGSNEKKLSYDLIKAVASLSKGNEQPLRNAGVSQIIIRNMQHIMNNYYIYYE